MARSNYCPQCMTTFVTEEVRCPNLGCARARPDGGWAIVMGEGDVLDRHYRIQRPLAVGGAGLCYLALEIDDEGEAQPPDLAIKVLYAQRDSGPFLRRLANEAQILQDLDNDHIVECRGFVQRTGHAPYLVTLYERGGSLADHVESQGTLDPTRAAGVIVQILHALCVAHERGVVHRDLKPQNVLLRERVAVGVIPRIRVVDFGIAKVSGAMGAGLTSVGSFVGTPEYAAPEQFSGGLATPATDVYAVGALLYFLLLGRSPIRFSHRMDIAHSYEEMRTQIPPKLPPELGTSREVAVLQAVLDQTMTQGPGDRATAREVIATLERLPGVQAPELPPPSGPTSVRGPALSTPLPTTLGGESSETIVAWMGKDAVEVKHDEGSDLSLDDLFGFHEAPAVEEPPRRPRPGPQAAEQPPPRPPRRAAVTWEPEEPRSLPSPLPNRAKPLLDLLGRVRAADRGPLIRDLEALPESDLSVARALAVAGTPGQKRGVLLLLAAESRREWADLAESMLRDRDPDVRTCAEQSLRMLGLDD